MTSPTTAWLKTVDMISSTDGWIVGADGDIYHLQEEELHLFPADFLLIIVGVAVAAIIGAASYWALRKRK